MIPFKFNSPADVNQALELASNNDNAQYLGGGTNLIDLMKENVEQPDELIEVADLSYKDIKKTSDGGLSLGATATNTETANHPLVRENYPLLTMAILAGATEQIRNMATNGGNLLQRTRCPYFYETAMPCNKREPGTGCGAKNGMNKLHAIFGWSDDCVAVHPSDMCVALAALNATVTVQQPDGKTKAIPFSGFHRLPGNQPEKDTDLEAGELITSITLPKPLFPDHYYYLKIRGRSSYAFALVSIAAGLQLENGTIKKAGLAMGGVAHKPWKLSKTEKMLVGKKPEKQVFEEAARLAMKEAKPLSQNEYKITLGEKAIAMALTKSSNR